MGLHAQCTTRYHECSHVHGAVTVCDVQLQRVSLYEANPICFLYTPQHRRSLTPSLTTRVDPRTTRAFIPSLTVGRDLPYTTAVEAPPRHTRDTRREPAGRSAPPPPRAQPTPTLHACAFLLKRTRWRSCGGALTTSTSQWRPGEHYGWWWFGGMVVKLLGGGKALG